MERFRGKVFGKPQIIIHLQHTSGEFGLFPGGGVCSEEKNRKEKEKRRRREADGEEKKKTEAQEKQKRRKREGAEEEERREREEKEKRKRSTKGGCRQDLSSAEAEEAGEAGANDF